MTTPQPIRSVRLARPGRAAPRSSAVRPHRSRSRGVDQYGIRTSRADGTPDPGSPAIDGGIRVDTDASVKRYGPDTDGPINSVLVPIAGGPHSKAAVDVAAEVADRRDASLSVMTVVSPSAARSARGMAEARLHNYADTIDRAPTNADLYTRNDVVAAIADRSYDHGLVVVGASERSLLGRLLRGTVPERLDGRAAAPVLVVERETSPG